MRVPIGSGTWFHSCMTDRGGELGVLRVRKHPLSEKVHPLIAKSTLSKQKKKVIKHHFKPISNKDIVIKT